MNTERKAKLRIGLLVDTLSLPQWVHQFVKEVHESSIAEVVVVVRNQARKPTGLGARIRTLVKKRQHLLRKAYTETDDWLFRSEPDPFRRMDASGVFNGASILDVAPRQTLHCDYVSDKDAHAIREYNLDVAFRFGFRILKGEILDIARYGVWSFHHGDYMVNRGGPAGFWEVMEGHPVTGTTLQVLTPELDAGKILSRSWSSTYKYSVRRNKTNQYWKSPKLAFRALEKLYETGELPLESNGNGNGNGYAPYSNRLYKAPTNTEMCRLLAGLGARTARRIGSQIFQRGQWILAYKIAKPGAPPTKFYDFKLMEPPKDRFWADPFPVEVDGKCYIFIEELIYRNKKGHISVIELNADGSWTPPRIVLEKEFHLSHPFVFEWEGSHYMVPETNRAKRLELYRCTEFPNKWTLDRVLMDDIAISDATFAEVDGLWWMFANVYSDGISSNDELYLFHARSPLGPWTAHANNPVKSDVGSSRPAGSLVRWNGKLIRPAQDSSLDYGHSITLNEIDCLSPTEFREREVARIEPQWNPSVCRNHTINQSGKFSVIDAYRYRRRLF